MLRSSSNVVKTFIGYAAAEDHRHKYLCFYCGGSLIIESDQENFEYGTVECLLCSRPSAVIKPEDWKKNQEMLRRAKLDQSRPALGRPKKELVAP